MTNNGHRNLQRTSITPEIGDDGNTWYRHIYSRSFEQYTEDILHSMQIRINKNRRADNLIFNITSNVGDENSFYYQNNKNRNLSISINDLFQTDPRFMTEEANLRIKGNTKVIISHVPKDINNPYDYTIKCKNISGFNFIVDSLEANIGGPDIFSVNCIGESNNGETLFYEIVNETAKQYCRPIKFTIDIEYGLKFKEHLRAIDYSDVFDIRAQFE